MSPRSWAAWNGARLAGRRFRAAWRRLPREARARWASALGGGLLLAAALMLGLTLLGRRLVGRGMQAWDRRVLEELAAGPFLSFDAAVWWEAFGASSMLIPVAATATVLAILASRPLLALTIAASYLLAKPLILIGWQLWDRSRPTLVAGGIAAPPLHSYPSGHALQTAAVYGLLFYLWIRVSRSAPERVLAATCWAALTVMVGVARLRTGVHWPSDVVAGTVVGTAWAAALVLALRRAEAAGGR